MLFGFAAGEVIPVAEVGMLSLIRRETSLWLTSKSQRTRLVVHLCQVITHGWIQVGGLQGCRSPY